MFKVRKFKILINLLKHKAIPCKHEYDILVQLTKKQMQSYLKGYEGTYTSLFQRHISSNTSTKTTYSSILMAGAVRECIKPDTEEAAEM